MWKEQSFQMMLGQLYIHTQNNEAGLLHFTPCMKINSKWIKYPNVRAKAVKLLEENTGVNLYDLALDNSFLDMIPEAQPTKGKIDELDFIKMKKFVLQRTLSRK